MKIPAQPSMVDNIEAYAVRFEFNSENETHEAWVAINALAAWHRDSYGKKDSMLGANGRQKFEAATERWIEFGADNYVAKLQRACQERSPAGRLTDEIRANTTHHILQLLCESLDQYITHTPHAVLNEMHNSMGNIAGVHRTNEAVTADLMQLQIKEAVGIEARPEEARRPVGFW